jgi:nucleotide-binding universal stress UspA family protein
MSERILVPLDGSELSEAAIRYVEDLVSKMSSAKRVEVTLFHAVTAQKHDVEISGGGRGTLTVPYSETELEQMRADALQYLNKVGENLKKIGINVSAKVNIGRDAAAEIIKAEEEVNADLVAMSTHGRAGISRWAYGSVTDKVLRSGKVPVLMVRARK